MPQVFSLSSISGLHIGDSRNFSASGIPLRAFDDAFDDPVAWAKGSLTYPERLADLVLRSGDPETCFAGFSPRSAQPVV